MSFVFGTSMILLSLVIMLYNHEFTLSGIIFIAGIIIVGIGYASLPDSEEQTINTKQINKNLQTFNDVLWRKGKKPPKKPGPQINIIIVQKK